MGRQLFLDVMTGIAWVAEVYTTFFRRVATADHSFVGCVALALTFIAVARRYRGTRLKPGERIIDGEQQRELEGAVTRAVLAGYRAEGQPPQSVRAVRLCLR